VYNNVSGKHAAHIYIQGRNDMADDTCNKPEDHRRKNQHFENLNSYSFLLTWSNIVLLEVRFGCLFSAIKLNK
jgi:hypothetical protein